MPKFSKKLDTIATAEASQLLGRAKDLQREGKEVTILSVGEPDFDTHDSVKEAAKVAIDAGNTKYAPLQGIFEVREAICVKLKRDNGIEYDPSNIITSTGAKQVIFNAMMATLDAGDEVILPHHTGQDILTPFACAEENLCLWKPLRMMTTCSLRVL